MFCSQPRPAWYAEICEILRSNGLSQERIRFPGAFNFSFGTTKHCPRTGHYSYRDGLGFKVCCAGKYKNFISTEDFKNDLEDYYTFCEHLRNSLNDGKLTSCADCTLLLDGRSKEPLRI